MKKFVSLLLCLSLIGFAVARAMTLGHTLAAVAKNRPEKANGTKSRHQNFTGQREQGVGCDD
jgi:hypothetical protein